jgi:hypothetical protein
MDKIKVLTKRSCDGCVMREYEGYDCLISNISGYSIDCYDDRNYEDDNGYDAFKICKCRIEWNDLENIVKWFFETQKGKIEYVED